ncbi:MAG: DUF1573 domain-containing protein [Flavobacteriales bacterium]|nr:DUF1573 domain-containing protein [Flavobacteriales bacterium]
MKKKLFVLGGLLAGFIFSNAQSIKFEQETIDYQTVKKGTDKERVFKFTNEGDKPLILTNVTASCGCTVPSYPKEPILPGKSGEINVTYDTNRVGPFNKKITVNSNDPEFGRKVLTIKGVVAAEETSTTK